MNKKLFGNNIVPNCSYCHHYVENENGNYCEKKKEIKDDKCKKFSYNPLLRQPRTMPKMMNFSKEDFEL